MTKKEITEIEKELEIPKIPTLDLSFHIKLCKENPKLKIGILNEEINSLSSYKKGDVVLFEPYSVEECYGKMLWEQMERHTKLCTISVPSDRYFKGESNGSTIKCMVGVPLSLIKYEIIIG